MTRTFGLLLVLGALLLGACESVNEDAIEAEALACPEGSDCYDPVAAPGPGDAFTIETGDLFFEFDGQNTNEGEVNVEVTSGPVEVTVDNIGNVVHNFRVNQALGEQKKVEAQAGETVTGTLQLFPGEFTFFCDIPGHRSAGMEGRIVVDEG